MPGKKYTPTMFLSIWSAVEGEELKTGSTGL